MICPNCHCENRAGAKFCNECGSPLVGPSDKTVVLPVLTGQDKPREDAEEKACPAATALELELERVGEDELDDFTDVDEEIAEVEIPLEEDGEDELGEDTEEEPDDGADNLTGDGAASDGADETPSDEEPAGSGEETADEKSDADPEAAPSRSGRLHALDPARVPVIDVTGEKDPADYSSDKTQVINIDAAKTADLSGLERLVDSSYVPPAPSWRSGDTMELPKIEGEPPKAQREFKAPDPVEEKKRSRKKHVLVALLVIVIAAAIAAGSTYYLELWGGKTVPDVTGEAQSDAVWVLESKGFHVNTTQVKSDEVEGIVLITDPQAGSRVEKGTAINVSIATPRAVPDIMGKTQDDAKAALDKEGLDNVTFTTEKSDDDEGTVIALSLDAGTKVKAATALTVTIAEAYTVPDVTGKSEDDAKAALNDAGYKVKTKTTYTEDTAEGTVISSDPEAGTKHASGTTVTLNVAKSRAKELVSETKDYFSKGATVVIDGVNCEIVSCDSVDYEGDGVVSYTITAKKFEKTTLFGTLFANSEQMSGTITWGSDNSIRSSSPKLSK